MKTLMIILTLALGGCSTAYYVPEQPPQYVGGYIVYPAPPELAVVQNRISTATGFFDGCLSTAYQAELINKRRPKKLELQGYCVDQMIKKYSWISQTSDDNLHRIRLDLELIMARYIWE